MAVEQMKEWLVRFPVGNDVSAAAAQKSLLDWAGGARVTLAIVFTDIVGSTALGVELGDAAMGEVRRKHFAHGAALIERHGGRKIKTIGDSIMAVFRSVDAALDFAESLRADPGSPDIEVRTGINIGAVDISENDVFGTEVNLASRIIAQVVTAEIWLSGRAKEDVDRVAPNGRPGWHWQPHPAELKGIGKTQLWSLVVESAADDDVSPPPRDRASAASAAAEEQVVAARSYFAPELARVVARLIHILDCAASNVGVVSMGRRPADRWLSLKPAQPVLYPASPEFVHLPAADATLLIEFYNGVQEIADLIGDLIEKDIPQTDVNSWQFLMQTVQAGLRLGKAAVVRFCPDRPFSAATPTAGTLVEQIDRVCAVATAGPAAPPSRGGSSPTSRSTTRSAWAPFR